MLKNGGDMALEILRVLCKYARKIGEKPDDVINELLSDMILIMQVVTFNDGD